jgi:hypothetical protein
MVSGVDNLLLVVFLVVVVMDVVINDNLSSATDQ